MLNGEGVSSRSTVLWLPGDLLFWCKYRAVRPSRSGFGCVRAKSRLGFVPEQRRWRLEVVGVLLLGGWTAVVFGQAMWWLLVDAVSVWLGLIVVDRGGRLICVGLGFFELL